MTLWFRLCFLQVNYTIQHNYIDGKKNETFSHNTLFIIVLLLLIWAYKLTGLQDIFLLNLFVVMKEQSSLIPALSCTFKKNPNYLPTT